MTTETLNTPASESPSNGTGEPNPPENSATVSPSSPDTKPPADDEHGEKRIPTETLDTPASESTSNGTGTGESNPPENSATVGHQSPDTKPPVDDEHGEKRKRTETEEETVSVHPLWKTSLCSYFRRTGAACSHGETCRYAHGEAELRIRPDNTWDPTSEKAKKMKKMKVDTEGGTEASGDRDDGVMIKDSISDEECSESALDKCFVNLPMKWSADNLKKFLIDQGVEYKSAKTRKGMVVGFVSFETVEQVKAATEKLQGKPIGNKNLKIVDATPRSFERKVKPSSEPDNKAEDGGLVNDDSTPGSLVAKGRSARDAVTPLAHMSYADQLEHKKKNIMQILKKLARNGRKACPDGVALPDWIVKSREIAGLACKLEGIIESPLVNGYRNKCEFSVGYSQQGKPTVGFLLGNFREGVTAVEEPSDCPNVSRISCKYAEIFQNFLQNSTFPIWNRMTNTGFWRQLTVREGRRQGESNIAEALLMVQISSAGFDNEAVNVELEKMAEAFVAGASTESPSLPLTVLAVQDHQGVSNVAPADAPLRTLPLVKSEAAPEARIQDYINNLGFCISPTAFFQVNTLAAEKLYALAGDWACLGPNTLLFDVCCGTGTIGLTLANRVGMVVGIEMNASAVADANRNAEINGINNCRFVCSKAEDVMGSLLKEYLIKEPDGDIGNKEATSAPEEKSLDAEDSKTHCFDNVVAIVDPPRVGLHPTVIKALRTHSGLKRLVYISCNPESLMANAIELCAPSADKTEKGNNNNRGWRNMSSASLARQRAKSMPASDPFQPVKAMAVDLFPHTAHCELVMLLER
ncbi:putative tRNA (uracil(54)-C(5))-methyltransferase transcription factor C3H family [Helianthus annuus]|uniref:Putative zinc finger (CCCH-type) family protein n=1 Tax=Helianthus annuus TaxID=4232 RepID=A0A251SRU7_HELAN|nr:zinc finger CCCH domain-containing protein 24 [Helianthus annuus]KAF5773477.1 putative tRNA (uracil(54)-C(5))-methyltransferase transcription factor C3H family [Helianthus annuus]KAJ0481322.1 putative tRNA (uracil(54)-C(5))-methyltransferase transcription factor C3H family [Helianthus annuus]KAJ0497790.1 putative tRNA (uracil(54)-C(5))-methyltransferase transcription factor C3H family [Helianthus annuus]KAJ0671286.1 putative tRNA (uracil(54)-C(5))-methyltransferase transcription factor C3H f